jgi:hypothetical protein
VRELWGGSVLHCAYCHGWEVRGQRIGVLATGPLSVHQALVFRQLSDRVTFFLHDHQGPDDEERRQFAALGIEVVEGRVSHLARSRVCCTAWSWSTVRSTSWTPSRCPRAWSRGRRCSSSSVARSPSTWPAATSPPARWDVPAFPASSQREPRRPRRDAVGGDRLGVTAATAINSELVAEDAAAAVARSRGRAVVAREAPGLD